MRWAWSRRLCGRRKSNASKSNVWRSGLGPGSYTGIRLAIALAQGWQLARPVKLLGISSAECLAAQAQAEGIFGRVQVVIDAQRNEFYLAGYDLSAEAPREIEPLRLATLPEVQARQQAGGIIIGPEVTNWFPGSRVLFPRAATLGRLARGRTDFVPGEETGADLPARNPIRQSPAAAHRALLTLGHRDPQPLARQHS